MDEENKVLTIPSVKTAYMEEKNNGLIVLV